MEVPNGSVFDFQTALLHFNERVKVHNKLIKLFIGQKKSDYALLAIGDTNPHGNFSASDAAHNMIPYILDNNTEEEIFWLGTSIFNIKSVVSLPKVVLQSAKLNGIGISIGSEMGMMLKPNDIWVGNLRTFWAWMFVTKGLKNANANLLMYKQRKKGMSGVSNLTDLDYSFWRDLYLSIQGALDFLYDWSLTTKVCGLSGVDLKRFSKKVSGYKYIWADVVANQLYDENANK